MMIYALCNYTQLQLKAMGAAVEGITQGAVPSAYGIIALAIIMVIYETLGGMRSVAWTDVIQGVVLLVGFALLVMIVPTQLGGGLDAVVEKLREIDPAKVQVPDGNGSNTWISYVLLLGCGAAIYPQAIQRLYASRSLQVLKRSLMLMAFMPLTTTLIALICGLTAIVVLPGLESVETDQVLARILAMVMAQSTLGALVGSGRICRGAGRAYVDGRFCAPVDLFDVHARYLSALHQAREQRGASHARGQSILMAGRCAPSGSCDRHGKNARAPARAKI